MEILISGQNRENEYVKTQLTVLVILDICITYL